jgi:hypothetical protein
MPRVHNTRQARRALSARPLALLYRLRHQLLSLSFFFGQQPQQHLSLNFVGWGVKLLFEELEVLSVNEIFGGERSLYRSFPVPQ